jgi:hypothetical protein
VYAGVRRATSPLLTQMSGHPPSQTRSTLFCACRAGAAPAGAAPTRAARQVGPPDLAPVPQEVGPLRLAKGAPSDTLYLVHPQARLFTLAHLATSVPPTSSALRSTHSALRGLRQASLPRAGPHARASQPARPYLSSSSQRKREGTRLRRTGTSARGRRRRRPARASGPVLRRVVPAVLHASVVGGLERLERGPPWLGSHGRRSPSAKSDLTAPPVAVGARARRGSERGEPTAGGSTAAGCAGRPRGQPAGETRQQGRSHVPCSVLRALSTASASLGSRSLAHLGWQRTGNGRRFL